MQRARIPLPHRLIELGGSPNDPAPATWGLVPSFEVPVPNLQSDSMFPASIDPRFGYRDDPAGPKPRSIGENAPGSPNDPATAAWAAVPPARQNALSATMHRLIEVVVRGSPNHPTSATWGAVRMWEWDDGSSHAWDPSSPTDSTWPAGQSL